MNFRAAYEKLADVNSAAPLGVGHAIRENLVPTDRTTHPQPMPRTDGLDPAAGTGGAMYGSPVVDDPLLTEPIRPGEGVPFHRGPDVNETTLI